MIIFDFDGTLANCQHRRHFVDPYRHSLKELPIDMATNEMPAGLYTMENIPWKPDWKLFYEACDRDEPILPVLRIFESLCETYLTRQISIWSGRCESVKDKTIKWLDEYLDVDNLGEIKMRPIGDNTPDDQLKERWLDEALAQGKTIDFVFDADKKSIEMWRRRGVFVFDLKM